MINQAIQRMVAIIDSFREQVTKVGNIPIEGIDKVEGILGVKFPEEYRVFLNRYGAITIGDLRVYGISYPVDREPSIVWALQGLWKIFPEIPKNLIPIRDLSELGAVVCIQCQSLESHNTDAPIVLWRFDPEPNEENIVHLCQDFSTYLSQILIEIKHRRTAFSVLEKHVDEFERDYLSVEKLPRNYVWRPYRFCSQDVVLGLTVVRHSVDNNCLEVDVCMTSDVLEFEEGIGAKITTSFLLSEAYKCGGSMEIRFSENVEGGRVPNAICDLAEKYGVPLSYTMKGRIAPSEARFLYLAISEFSQSLRDLIEALYQEGRLSIERPCYALYHGLWTRAQIENIILGSPKPENILGGDSWPEQRHLYLNDLMHASAAVMGGVLDRKLAKRERNTGIEALDLEDDVRPIDIYFNPDYYAKIYSCEEEVTIPWVKEQSTQIVKPGNEIVVLVRVYDIEDLTRYLVHDILVAKGLTQRINKTDQTPYVYILVPRDFEDLPQKFQNSLVSYAEKNGVGILVCPETVVALEADGSRRLASSRIMRE
jgi:hypothetical protein